MPDPATIIVSVAGFLAAGFCGVIWRRVDALDKSFDDFQVRIIDRLARIETKIDHASNGKK